MLSLLFKESSVVSRSFSLGGQKTPALRSDLRLWAELSVSGLGGTHLGLHDVTPACLPVLITGLSFL